MRSSPHFGKVELLGKCALRLNLESPWLHMSSCNGCYLLILADQGHLGPRGRQHQVLPYQATRIMLGATPLPGQYLLGWSLNWASSSPRLLQQTVLLVTEYIFLVARDLCYITDNGYYMV